MPLEPTDPKNLWDMLDAARTVVSMTSGTSYDEYLGNRMMQLAVERAIEIVGEAARKVSDGCKNDHPEIPWRPIVAQRHVLAHDYGDIKHDRIWRVITIHVPELIKSLEPLVQPPTPPTGGG